MASKPWNPRKLKNEIADAMKEMHRLSCALSKESTAVIENQKDTQAVDIELIGEGAHELKKCMDRLVMLWEIAGYPNDDEGILFRLGIL
jgi:hypothetical protein